VICIIKGNHIVKSSFGNAGGLYWNESDIPIMIITIIIMCLARKLTTPEPGYCVRLKPKNATFFHMSLKRYLSTMGDWGTTGELPLARHDTSHKSKGQHASTFVNIWNRINNIKKLTTGEKSKKSFGAAPSHLLGRIGLASQININWKILLTL